MDRPNDAPQPQYDAAQPAVACGNCRRALPGPNVPAQCPFCGTAQSYSNWTVLNPTLPNLGEGSLLSKTFGVFRLAPRATFILFGLQVLINVVIALAQQASQPSGAVSSSNGASSIFLLISLLVAIVNIGIMTAITKIWAAAGTSKPMTVSEGVEGAQREFWSYIGAILLGGLLWFATIFVATLVLFIPAFIASGDAVSSVVQKLQALGPNDSVPTSMFEPLLTGPVIAAFVLLVLFVSYSQVRVFGVLYPILALERKQNMGALRRNWSITRGRRGWVYFGLSLVTFLPTVFALLIPAYSATPGLPTLVSGLLGVYLAALGFAIYVEARRKGA